MVATLKNIKYFIFSNVQVLYSGSDVWLSYWTNQEQTRIKNMILVPPLNDTVTDAESFHVLDGLGDRDLPPPLVDTFG